MNSDNTLSGIQRCLLCERTMRRNGDVTHQSCADIEVDDARSRSIIDEMANIAEFAVFNEDVAYHRDHPQFVHATHLSALTLVALSHFATSGAALAQINSHQQNSSYQQNNLLFAAPTPVVQPASVGPPAARVPSAAAPANSFAGIASYKALLETLSTQTSEGSMTKVVFMSFTPPTTADLREKVNIRVPQFVD